jgi:outer membrane usher protein
VEASPYLGARLLAPGVHDFAVAAGVRRERLGIESFDYGSPVLFARERLGLTDRLTVGARFEASTGLASGGVSVDAVAPVGEVQAEVAASGDHGEAGAAATGSWQLRRRAWSTAAYVRWASPRYATASLSAASDRETLRAGAIASLYATRRLTFSGELATALRRDTARETVLDVRAMYTLAMGQMLALEARTSSAPGRSTVVGVFASVVFQAGGGASGSMSARARSDDTGGASIGLQKPLPPGPGYGYDLRATSLEREGQVNALAEAQATFGRAEATYDQIGGTRSGSFSVAGGVVALREGVFLARPVEQSFALVQVGDVPGVRTYLENQPMGSTDGSGKILVPSLGAFRANRISIADGDVPIDRTILSREMLVVAPRRAGAVARFAADRLQAVTGRLRVLDAAGVATPVGGMIRLGVDGRVVSSPIGEDGTFWLENVPAGSHPAEIFWRGRLCRFSIPVPDAKPGLQDLGELACGTEPRSERRDLTPAEIDALTRGEPGALPPPAPVPAPADVARATP